MWWYQKYAPENVILAELQRGARKSGLGLWADPHPVPPWEWRKGRAHFVPLKRVSHCRRDVPMGVMALANVEGRSGLPQTGVANTVWSVARSASIFRGFST